MTARIKKVQNTIGASTKMSVSGSRPQETLRTFKLNQGLLSLETMREELDEYVSVLLGNSESPTGDGEMAMIEYANAVYSRGMELTLMLQRAEAEGIVSKGSKFYKFRTGELRTFTEMASKAIDLGSRRLTYAKMQYDMSRG